MNQNQGSRREQEGFFMRPTEIIEPIRRVDLLVVPKNQQKYRVVKGVNNEELRIYKRSFIDYDKEMKIIKWRNEVCKPIVKVVYIQIAKDQPLQDKDHLMADIYTEHLTTKLSDIKNLGLAQTLYLLKKTVNGFDAILSLLGYVTIHPAHCGITAKGDCKVWINENLSQNKGGLQPKLQHEGQIVSQILKIIKQCANNQCNSFFSYLMRSISSIEKLKFKLIDQVISYYCLTYQITIPLYLKYQTDSQSVIQEGQSNTNQNTGFGKIKITKSYSNYSYNQKHRGSQFSSKDSTTSSFRSSQRSSLVQKIPSLLKMENRERPLSNIPHKKYSLAQNPFPSSLFGHKQSSQSILTKTIPKYTRLEDQSRNDNSNLTLSKSKLDPKTSTELPNSMIRSSVKQMISLNNILMCIAEGNDETVENLNSDHILEGTRQEITVPSQREYRKPLRKNYRICLQFSINLICQKIAAQTQRAPKNDQLKISFTTATKTYCESANVTPRPDRYLTENNGRKSQMATSFSSQEFDDLRMSPRFSYEGLEVGVFKQRCLNSQQLLRHTSNTSNTSFITKKQAQPATCFNPNYNLEDKENRSLLFSKLYQQKRLSQKRRNSRLVREQLEEQEENRMHTQQQNSILYANKWKKVVSTLTEGSEDLNLQQSITLEGTGEKQRKRSPIKLNMLDQLGRGLTESIIPR